MKIRALKRLAGSYGLLNKGDVIDLPNYLANDLLALGYVEVVAEIVSADAEVVPAVEAIPDKPKRGRKNASR